MIQEQSPTGTLIRRYLNGPLGAARYQVAGTGTPAQYLHRDPLGNITDTTSPTGVTQWKYEYDPYGRARTTTNVSGTAPENRLQFTGAYLDSETTDYALQAREYSPSTGSFRQTDPIDNQLLDPMAAPYVYVAANPARFADPAGASLEDTVNSITGGLGSTASSLKSDLVDPVGQIWADPVGAFETNARNVGGAVLACRGDIHCVMQRLVVDPVLAQGKEVVNLAKCGDYQAAFGRAAALGIEFVPLVRAGRTVSAFKLAGAAKTESGLRRLLTEESWANPGTLGRHFREHGADFAAGSADDHARMASEFFQRGGAQQLPTKIASDGTIRMFDPANNTFGSFAPNGMTKTFFKPTSTKYWQRQPGVLG